MIRLDHHTSPLSPNPKQSPEHKIIPWDDAHFSVSMDDIAHDSTENGKQQPSDPASPPSPADGNSASPTGERSSSLSPVPPLADEKEAALETSHPESVKESERAAEESATRVDKLDESRQSTPLSELSPAPDQDEEINGEGEESSADAEVAESIQKVEASEKGPSEVDQKPIDQPRSPSTAQAEPAPRINPPASPSASIGTPAPMTPTIPTTSPSTSTVMQDPKVVTILELNVELLKCVILVF